MTGKFPHTLSLLEVGFVTIMVTHLNGDDPVRTLTSFRDLVLTFVFVDSGEGAVATEHRV